MLISLTFNELGSFRTRPDILAVDLTRKNIFIFSPIFLFVVWFM